MYLLKKSFLSLSVICFLFFSGFSAYGECLVFPPVCPIEACGYQTQESPQEQMMQKSISVCKESYKTFKKARKSVHNIFKTAISLPATISSLVLKAITYPFSKLNEWLGLTEEAQEEDTENITQDNSHGDITIAERIVLDSNAYKTEASADPETQEFNKKRRQYIRQQTTITLLARVLTLKAKLKSIKEIMDEVSKQVNKNVNESSGEPSKTYNESALIKTNYELREAWFALLIIQRHIEATKLEFIANQSMAGMNMVKKVPTITSNEKKSQSSTK